MAHIIALIYISIYWFFKMLPTLEFHLGGIARIELLPLVSDQLLRHLSYYIYVADMCRCVDERRDVI